MTSSCIPACSRPQRNVDICSASVEEWRDQREHFAGPLCHAHVRGSWEHCEVARSAGVRTAPARQAAVRSHGRQRSAGSVPAVTATRRSSPETRAPFSRSGPRTFSRREVRGVWGHRVVGFAHRLKVGRRRRYGRRQVARSPGPAGGGGPAEAAAISLPTRAGAPGRCDRVRDEAAEAKPEEVGLSDAQMIEQRYNVTSQRLDRHLAVCVGSVPMALKLHRDHLPARRKGFEQRPGN